MYKYWLLLIENKKVNAKNTFILLIAQSYTRTECVYNANLTFMNVANSKQANFSTGLKISEDAFKCTDGDHFKT